MNHDQTQWSPSSWRKYPTLHQPSFRDQERLSEVLKTVKSLPPLVPAAEVDKLRRQLRLVHAGKALILQAGDCAETFAECNEEKLSVQLRVICSMAALISAGFNKPIIKIGRIAGQYAKPRSADVEEVNGCRVPVFLGDNINGFELDARDPDPQRLLRAYFYSALSLNYLNSFKKPHIHDASTYSAEISADDLFTSHESLFLAYEEQQTRYVEGHGAWYNLSAHMLWIGERTRHLTGGHIEYARGIANPIGLKVGPKADAAEILAIIERLNPCNDIGKLVLITRFGKDHTSKLRSLVTAVNASGRHVLWLCDPMHGNTHILPNGLKTRSVDDIISEIRETSAIHAELGRPLGGLHLEVSGEAVTECIGGSGNLTIDQLAENYKTTCDPRLNYRQSLDVAEVFSQIGTWAASPSVCAVHDFHCLRGVKP